MWFLNLAKSTLNKKYSEPEFAPVSPTLPASPELESIRGITEIRRVKSKEG